MEVLRRRTAPRYVREEGITSYLLASPVTSQTTHLTTSQVEIEPGGEQRMHSHAPEQVDYIVEGEGVMTIGDEKAHVVKGDCVFVPSGTPHGLENNARVLLKYFSAAAPSFDREELRSLWPLKSEADVETT